MKKKDSSRMEEFLKLRSFAIIGVSARKNKFGNIIFKQMLKRGFNIYPIHRISMLIDSQPCYPNIASLPERPEGIILVIPPAETEKMVKELAAEGIKNLWIQQGAESPQALKYCSEHGMNVISKECLLMFLQKPGLFHNFHRWAAGYSHK